MPAPLTDTHPERLAVISKVLEFIGHEHCTPAIIDTRFFQYERPHQPFTLVARFGAAETRDFVFTSKGTIRNTTADQIFSNGDQQQVYMNALMITASFSVWCRAQKFTMARGMAQCMGNQKSTSFEVRVNNSQWITILAKSNLLVFEASCAHLPIKPFVKPNARSGNSTNTNAIRAPQAAAGTAK